jgi:type VI secretion system protein ImpF
MDYEIRPSIMDRLLDDEDTKRSFSMYDLRGSVRRDLESLFNTRQRFISAPEHLVETQESVINYGLPDLASINLANERTADEFGKKLERIIKYYEPRFKSVRVETFSSNEADGLLRFRVNAVLYADPAPEIVIYDSQLDSTSKSFNVNESKS